MSNFTFKPKHISALLLLCAVVLTACAGKEAGADPAESQVDWSGWDHVVIEASSDTSAEMLQEDYAIIEERLASCAGEGRYHMELTVWEDGEDNDRLDIYLDPELKGSDALSVFADRYIYAPRRFCLYSSDTGFLDLQEGQFLDLMPEDLVRAERTEADTSQGLTIEFSDPFLKNHDEQLELWQDKLLLTLDIRSCTTSAWLEGKKVWFWHLQKTEDPAVWIIDPKTLSGDWADYLADSLTEAPLSGHYGAACLSAVEWEKEMPEMDGQDTAVITLRQTDRGMDDESRMQLIEGLQKRLDALGMPYCLGKIRGQEGTVAIRTLSNRMNGDILSLLQTADPLYVTANVYALNLKGGRAAASIVSNEDGSLALDLSLTQEGMDSLLRMSQAQEELGGGEICIRLAKNKPICAAFTDKGITDGHIVFDRNCIGIGGNTWNEENQWVLELLCTMINDGNYPEMKETDMITGGRVQNLLTGREYVIQETNGLLHVPEDTGFTDAEIRPDILSKLRSFAPEAEITDRSDFGLYTIQLNLDAEEITGEKREEALARVRQLILTGVMNNGNVFLTAEDESYMSFQTWYSMASLKTEMDGVLCEEMYDKYMSRIYEGNPAMVLLERRMNELALSMMKGLMQ